MNRILKNFSLKKFNTFGIEIYASYFTEVHQPQDLEKLAVEKFQRILFLGEGSNILFLNNFEGLVIHNEIKGFNIIEETQNHVMIEIGGGENWHSIVQKTVEKGWSGIENLALIPGKVGTAPVQNIGAYGREIQDVLVSCDIYDLKEKKYLKFTNRECGFGYRNSVFKKPENRNRLFIHRITLKLNKNTQPETGYQSLQKYLKEKQISSPTPLDIFNAVVEIRKSKLPDPSIIGNAGSFFKNPIISRQKFIQLQKKYPEIPFYPISDREVKIPAAWLIEKAGWKGYREGDAGVHEKQALVMVNYGDASGKDIFDLSEKILSDVKEKFGIALTREVNIV